MVNDDAYHCSDCRVCIEDYDHHCVFFSKCIGGGNIYCFWGSLGMVVVNFANIAVMIAVSSVWNDSGSGPKKPVVPAIQSNLADLVLN